MNHFMLPIQSEFSSEKWGESVSSASRYGNWAMEFLINEILKLGGKRRNLEIKIFGGGNVLSNMTDIGERNIAYVRKYIYEENFELAASDVGDRFPRKVLYFPDTGAVKVRKLKQTQNDTILQRELDYRKHLHNKPPKSGSVELFE
jgi:chemotaxis protein CheD